MLSIGRFLVILHWPDVHTLDMLAFPLDVFPLEVVHTIINFVISVAFDQIVATQYSRETCSAVYNRSMHRVECIIVFTSLNAVCPTCIVYTSYHLLADARALSCKLW